MIDDEPQIPRPRTELGENERHAQAGFYLALLAGIIRAFPIVIEWVIAIGVNRRRERGEARTWGLRTAALVAVDTLVALSVWGLASGFLPTPELPSTEAASAEAVGLFEIQGEAAQGAIGGAKGLIITAAISLLAILIASRRAPGGLRVGLAISGILALWVGGSLVGELLPFALLGGRTHAGMLLGIGLGALAGIAATALAIAWLRARDLLPSRERFRLTAFTSTLLLGLPFLAAAWTRSVALSLGLAGLLARCGFEVQAFDTARMFGDAGFSTAATWMLVAMIVLLTTLFEELLFRGLFLPWLSRGMGAFWAVIASGLVFGILHAHYGAFVLITVGYGLVLGWARVRSGTVLVPWLLHASVNAIASWPLWGPLVGSA